MNSIGNAENGPMPMPATAIANAAIIATIVVEPRAPNRSPAQPTIGKKINAIGTSRVANTPHRPNISCDPAKSVRKRATASPTRGQLHTVGRP